MQRTIRGKAVPRQRKEVDVSTFEGRFAVRLRKLREKTGMNVHELAEKSGVSKTTILNWESGIRKPIVSDTFLKLANALEVNVRTLLPKE